MRYTIGKLKIKQIEGTTMMISDTEMRMVKNTILMNL